MNRSPFLYALPLLLACAGGDEEIVGDATAGATVFADNCASCHAADGTGGSGPDLTGMTDEAEIEEYVVNGDGGMPAFGDTLSEQEIADVVAHVLTL